MPVFEGEKVEQRVFPGDRVQTEASPQKPDSGTMAYVNQGIAQLFGLPGDLVNMANRYIGAKPLPIGSESIQSGMRAMNIAVPRPGEQADDPTEIAAREIGAGLGFLVPFGGVARTAQTAMRAGRGGAITRTLGEAAETAGRRPIASSAAEAGGVLGAGAGAGAGYAVGEGTDYQEALQVLGSLAGGLSPAVVATAPSTAKLAARGARAAVDPFTRQGATFRAARRAQELAADPQAAASRLADDDILPESRGVVPPAQRTGESRLVGLQRALTDEDAALDKRLTERIETAEGMARQAGRDIGGAPPGASRGFLSQRRSEAVERFQRRASEAVNRAQDRLSRVENATPEQESRIVREELEGALKSAQVEENRLWSEVPKDASVSSSSTRQAFQNIQQRQGKLSDPEDVPALLRDRVPKISEQERVGDLQDLRSQVLRDIRAERAKDAPNRTRISNLEQMQSALLDDMGRAGGDAVNQALSFSRVLNQRFRQGPVGRVLGFERRGGPSVAPGETLARTVRGREAGGEGVDALQRALGDARVDEAADEAMNRVLQATSTGEGRQAISRFMQANFRQQAVNPDGTVDANAAERFLKKNREVLDRLPEVRSRIQEVAQSQRGAARATKQSQRITRNLSSKARSRLALYLDSPPEKAMQRVIDSNNPSESVRKLVNAARKDQSGMAMRGLKDEFVSTIMRQAETGSVDDAGERLVSGRRMRRLMDNEQVKQAMNQILTPSERKRLSQIANTFAKVEAGRDRTPNIGRPMEDLASSILEVPSRILGARVGAEAGGASMAGGLQSAQIISGRVRQLLRDKFSDKAREVLTDAVQSDELFNALMTMPTTRQRSKVVNQRLNSWLGAPATSEARSENERQQNP